MRKKAVREVRAMHNQWDLSQEQLVREKALYQYLSAFEHGDFESMGIVLQKAIQDPLLEAMILEAHEYYQAEEQITLRGDEREKILQMVVEHLPSDIWEEQDEMAIPPLTVADVIANIQQDRALTGSVKQERQMSSEQIPSPLKSPPYPAGLTVRELEVLRLVAQGLTNEEVAEQFVISPRTVDRHLTLIYRKIGVSSRSAAIRYVMQHHLV
jgi:DNA-binding CsgD family transcriptional regulator